MADLTPERLDALLAAYEREEPFHLVETERLATLPGAARDGSLMWKDVEWIVRWYYRRHLDDRFRADRERAEARFRDNPWGVVRAAIAAAIEADELAERVDQLADLEGITVPLATAILFFTDPEVDIVMGPREWRGLVSTHELRRAYPSSPGVPTYATYRRTCSAVADRLEAGYPDLYRALWRLGGE